MANDAKKSKKPTGKPLFDKATQQKLAQEALASGNVSQYASQKGINVFTLRRYIKHLKKADSSQSTVSKGSTASYRPSGGGQYRTSRVPDPDRLQQLEREKRVLSDTIIQLTLENARLKGN